jgi:hypothetical protein
MTTVGAIECLRLKVYSLSPDVGTSNAIGTTAIIDSSSLNVHVIGTSVNEEGLVVVDPESHASSVLNVKHAGVNLFDFAFVECRINDNGNVDIGTIFETIPCSTIPKNSAGMVSIPVSVVRDFAIVDHFLWVVRCCEKLRRGLHINEVIDGQPDVKRWEVKIDATAKIDATTKLKPK